MRAAVLAGTNDYRVLHGLAPLVAMAELDLVAQNWTLRMATDGVFEHNPNFFGEYPDGFSSGGENIAYGYRSASTVVEAWINSPGHRANLLGDFTHLGIGYVVDGSGTPYYTQNFAGY